MSDQITYVWFVAYVATLYLSWRLFAFRLLPLLRPGEPLQYPYWVPWLGHLVSFLQNSEALLASAAAHFNNRRAPFALTLAGSTVYIISDPRDVATVFREPKIFSFEEFLTDIMLAFGTSALGVRKIVVENHGGKTIAQRAHDLQVQQTQGQSLASLGAEIIANVRVMLGEEHPMTLPDVSRSQSLRDLIANISIRALQKAYFSEALEEIDPDLPTVLQKMDDLSWQVFYKIPKPFRSQLNGLVDRLLNVLRRYLALPQAERRYRCWFTPALEQLYEDAGVSQEDIATQMLFLYWGINTNVSKIGFWMMSYLLSRRPLLEEIRVEIGHAFAKEDGIPDEDFIYRSCPRLNAVFQESLRVSAASTVLRKVMQDTVVGGKLLRKDRRVLISARRMHFHIDNFGEDAAIFDAHRFANPRMERHPAFRPFGGGSTMCPGRHLAKYVTLNLVAILLHSYDFEISEDQRLPMFRENKPAIGIVSGEGDFFVRLLSRCSTDVRELNLDQDLERIRRVGR